MDKLLLLLTLIATASISVCRPIAAEWRLAGRYRTPFATDTDGSDAAVVLVAGKGGAGGGTTGGGMGGGGTGAGMFSPGPNFGTSDNGGWCGNSVQPSYYTYQCATPVRVCSFVAPAALRSSSLQAGTRCARAVGQPEGRVR